MDELEKGNQLVQKGQSRKTEIGAQPQTDRGRGVGLAVPHPADRWGAVHGSYKSGHSST